MDESPLSPEDLEKLSPEDLEKLVHLDEAIREKQGSNSRVDPGLLPPTMHAVAETLRILNQSDAPSGARKFAGMPKAIGKYPILSVLGFGGYGIVYLGDDPQLQRVVAIKVPLPGRISDDQSRQRFLKEVKATAMLEHPNIVPVYDAGIDGDEVFLVLAYCPGPALDEWLKSYDHPVPPRLAATIIQPLSSAIDYSHRQGILHRDLKPGNVLLFEDTHPSHSEFPFIPKITDFGLAKLLDDDDAKTASLQLQGTPQYMAPEQLIQGKRFNTPAIDIYALGVLLYRLLVGRTPFQFESIEEAVRKIELERPIPPHIIQSNVPKDLSIITMKCLEKSPQDRYRTAGDLMRDLENFLQGRPIQARPPSLLTRIKHWRREHPVAALLIAACTLLLTTFGALEYRYTRNLLAVNDALNQALATSKSQQRELTRRDETAKQLIYSADVAAAARAASENDPSLAMKVLSRYFSEDAVEGVRITPEFTAKYLWSQLRPAYRVFPSDTQSLWTVALSPDKKTVAAAGSQGNIVLHATREGDTPMRILRSEPVEINAISYTRDGHLLAAARDDGVIAIWDPRDERLLRTFRAISGEAYAVRFLGDSHTCAVAGRGHEVRICDADTGQVLQSLPVKLDKPVIECLDVSDDGTVLAVGGTDGHASMFDSQGNPRLSFLTWGAASVNSVCLVPNGRPDPYSLVLADKLGRLTLCNAGSDETRSLSVNDPIQAIVYLGEGLLLCGDKVGCLSLIELRRDTESNEFVDLRLLHRWAHHDGSLQAMDMERTVPLQDSRESSPSISRALSRPVYSVSRAGKLYRADLRSVSPRIAVDRIAGTERGYFTDFVDTTDDGRLLCQVTDDKIEWIEIPTGERLSLDTGRGTLVAVAKVPGKNQWLVGNLQGEMATVDRTFAGRDPRSIEWKSIFPNSGFAQLDFHPNTKWYSAIGGASDYPLSIRDLATGTPLFELNECRSVTFSKDGRWVAVGRRESNLIDVFDTTDWRLVTTLKKHRSTVHILNFTDDGRWLVSCSDDRMACFWDTTAWELHDTMILSGSVPSSAMTISPDSRTLVASDLAGRIALWDIPTRRELMVLRQEGALVLKVKFVADGTKLYAWDGNLELEVFETLGNPRVNPDADK